MDELLAAVRGLGSPLHDPLMQLVPALEVIPHLKLTDLGLVDVDAFELVSLWAAIDPDHGAPHQCGAPVDFV